MTGALDARRFHPFILLCRAGLKVARGRDRVACPVVDVTLFALVGLVFSIDGVCLVECVEWFG
jgi:hypothetical protein